MTFPVNLTLTCYYFETFVISRDVNSPRLCYDNKDGGGVNDLSCKPNYVLLLSRGVNRTRLCYVNKDGAGVNDLSCKLKLHLLLSRGVNSPRLCYANNEVDSVTSCLTCYGKQRRHFEFFVNMADTCVMFKPNLLFWTLSNRHFQFTAIWRTRAVILINANLNLNI